MTEQMRSHEAEQERSRQQDRLPRVIAIVAGIFFAVPGAWAMLDPRSFFEALAKFEPYNHHFLQDIGAFQIGLGVVLLLAGVRPRSDALANALTGVGVGAAFHAVSHIVGGDIGGTPERDIPVFVAVAVVLLVSGALRWRQERAFSR